MPFHQIHFSQRQYSAEFREFRKSHNSETENFPSDPEQLQLQFSVPGEPKETTEPRHDNRQPAPKQWLFSPKSLSLFDTAGGVTLNSATEFDD